jgi:hypothetical protein
MLWLGVIVSLCYVPGITGATIATQWPVMAVLLPFGLLREVHFTVFHGLGVLFLAYAAWGAYVSTVPYDAVFGLWLTAIMGTSLWVGSTLTSLRGLYVGLAIGGAVSSVVAVFQFFGWHPVVGTSAMPAGLYVNSVQQGTVLALLIVALASERMWLWIPALVPGLVIAQSRGAWLALAIGLLACYVRRLWVFGVLAVVGAYCLLLPMSSSDQERMMIWEVAWNGLKWLGWGPGSFYTVDIVQGNLVLFPGHAHNDILQLVFEYGVGAVLPLAIFGFALLHTDAREWPVLVAFAAAACYSMPLWMPIASLLGLACVGRILRDYAVPCNYGCYCGFDLLSRRPEWRGAGRKTVSVAPVDPKRLDTVRAARA